MKKVIQLTLLLLAILLPATATAYSFKSGGIYYETSSSNKVYVTYQGKIGEWDEIPSSMPEGYIYHDESHYDDDYSYYTYVYSDYSGQVVIPSTVSYNGTTYQVTGIGNRAFENCLNVTSITIPNSITSIYDWAFANCSCQSLTIPSSVTYLGSYLFKQYTGTVTVNCSSLQKVFEYDDGYPTYTYPFRSGGFSSITLSSNISNIPAYTFSDCTNLSAIDIDNISLSSIGNSAFEGCTKLKSVNISNLNNWFNCTFSTPASSPFYNGADLYVSNNKITNLAIPITVNSIPSYSFYGCTSLTGIIINNTVTTIGKYAFFGCTGLTSVAIPNSVNSIGSSAFSGCSGLTSIIVGSGNTTYDSRNDCNAIIETASNTLLQGCKNTTIPNSVTSIGGYAFYGCTGLTSATIGNSVTTIGNNAFYGCTGLTSVNIPNSVTSIGNAAFSRCSSLDTLNFNAVSCADFSSYSNHPFYNTNISTINIGNNVQKIPAYFAYGLTKLASVTIPNSVTSIGYSAFYGCTGLTSATIGNSVTSIGNYAFQNCTSLDTLNFNAVSCADFDYGSYKPFYNTNILTINIGNNVQTIPAYFAYGLTKLASVTIGNSVTSIGNSAFYGCSNIRDLAWNARNCSSMGNMPTINIEQVTIGDEVQTLPSSFVSGSKITSVTIPNSVTSIGSSAFNGCTGLASINVTDIAAWCNIIFSSNTANPLYYGHHLYLNGAEVTDLTIPNSVTNIRSSAFYGCTGLTSVNIPNSVTSIGSSAFYECTGLTSATIGNSVTTIGDNAFYGCTGLTSVNIPNSVTSIGNAVFSGDSSLDTLNFNAVSCADFSSNSNHPFYNTNISTINIGNNVQKIPAKFAYGLTKLASVTIPNSVASIGYSAFYGCTGLTSVNIPNSVTSIGNYAFSGCTGLTSATIGNSVTTIGNNAFSNCAGLISVTIPKSVTTIGNSAFSGCNLKALKYKAVNCSSIPANAFQQGITLNSLQFGDSVQFIPAGLPTFEMVGANLLIPNSVQSIASGALSSGVCDAVVIGNGLNGLEAGTFSEGIKVAYVSNAEPIPSAPAAFGDPQTLYVPGGSKVKYWTAQGWNEFKEIIQGPYTPVDALVIDSDISMPKGSTRQLTATISPTDATATSIKWFSKDATIATVDNNGVIQAINHGETDIYAVVDTVMAICHVNVNVALVEALTLNATQLLLKPDDIFTLIATANPDYAENKAVEWDIPENDVIVHFISGNSINIGTLQEGTVTVTAHTIDGSELTAGCTITVMQNIVHATSIELNQESAGLNEGETLQLTATVMPEDATDKSVTWATSDASVASVNQNGLVTAVAAGNATITASTIDGSELTATCEVTVNGTTLNNSLDADGMRIYCGEEKALAVRMNNESSITAVQCDIYLPEGISIATEDGDYLIDLDPTRKASNHTVSTNDLPNGAIRLFITSATSKPFKGNSGDLFVLNLVVADDAESGDYSLDLRNVILSDTEAHPYYAPDLNVPISIRDYIKGDVNSDRTVNVSDYVATANYILELDPHPFLFAAADIDENGTINVSDLVGVANIALNFMGASIIYHAPATSYEGPEQMVLAADCNTVASGKRVVTLDLSNSTAVTAFQMDITLPDGMSLVGASLSDRATASHSLEMTTLASGAYRLLGASMMSKAFADNEGTLLTLEIEGTASGVVVIDGIMVAEPNTTLHELGAMTLTFDASSIQETRSDVRIYTQDGMVVVESPVTDKVQFILPNGISVVKEVKAGRNVYRTGLNGIVIVKVGEQVKKFKL